jgi:hypothetical protein
MTPEQFWDRVEKSDGCWTFPNAAIRGGYKLVRWQGGRPAA